MTPIGGLTMKRLLVMSLLSLGLVACSKSTTEPFNPQMSGEILTISSTGSVFGIYIEGEASDESELTAASVTLNKETKLLNENGKNISFNDLKEGQWVAVEFEGDLAESYPVQATAKIVQLIEKTEDTKDETQSAESSDSETKTESK